MSAQRLKATFTLPSLIEHKAKPLKSGLTQTADISAQAKPRGTLGFIQKQLNPHQEIVYSKSQILEFHGNHWPAYKTRSSSIIPSPAKALLYFPFDQTKCPLSWLNIVREKPERRFVQHPEMEITPPIRPDSPHPTSKRISSFSLLDTQKISGSSALGTQCLAPLSPSRRQPGGGMQLNPTYPGSQVNKYCQTSISGETLQNIWSTRTVG